MTSARAAKTRPTDENDAAVLDTLMMARKKTRVPVISSAGGACNLEGLYRGSTVFLVCAGPSLRALDLDQLQRPGVVTMAINNAHRMVRPHLWFGLDSPCRFPDTLYRDPTVTKFVASQWHGTRVHSAPGHDAANLGPMIQAMPNTFFFRRRQTFDHRTFLGDVGFQCGPGPSKPCSVGYPGKTSSMLAALSCCHWLGFRRVVIIGADFSMTKGDCYATGEQHHVSVVDTNNATYQVLNKRFAALREPFAAAGFEVVNATPGGHLEAFDRVAYGDAIESAAASVGTARQATGWYGST